MTGIGLITVNLSALTPSQQVILVIVSLVGSPVRPTFISFCFEFSHIHRITSCQVFVSLVAVYVRKRYNTKNLD